MPTSLANHLLLFPVTVVYSISQVTFFFFYPFSVEETIRQKPEPNEEKQSIQKEKNVPIIIEFYEAKVPPAKSYSPSHSLLER